MISNTPWRPSGRLRSIVLAAGCAAVLAAPSAAQAKDEWTTEDIIDNRIDVDAQYALMRMMSPRDFSQHFAGSAILSAVKSGELGGIYQADRGVPAQRAQKAGGSWWTIVPKGFDATCYKAGTGAPIIVYRPGIGGSRERLDPALRSAWESCGIPPAEPLPYRVTLHKPPPPPTPAPPSLDPPPAAGLTVHVIDTNGRAVSGATVDTTDSAGGDSAETGGSGTVTFPSVPAGAVDVMVTGPADCNDDYTSVVMGTDPLTVEFTLDCTKPAPPPAPTCDPDKYTEVFDPCGKGVLGGAVKCLAGAYPAYLSCKLDPFCAAKNLKKFWECSQELDHNKKIQECNDKANAASNCKYKGPLD